MKLDRVDIKNFRSIKNSTISFDPTCRVLVGINESGKTNIIKALALLGGNVSPVRKNDLRETLPEEPQVDEAYVRFVFRLEKPDSDELVKALERKILGGNKKHPLVVADGKSMDVRQFCSERTEGLYAIDILGEKKRFTYWSIKEKYKLAEGWKRPSAQCPANCTIAVGDEKQVVNQLALIHQDDCADVPPEYLEDATLDDLIAHTGKVLQGLTEEGLPEVQLWEYDEKNLLPESIKIAAFSANPNACLPLKNMFALAGIEDIKTEIENARKGTDNQFQNFLSRIARKTTAHFHEVWKEYRDIEFSLRLNADAIVPGVQERNVYDFARRSDGFKRFVTFLLMISIGVKTERLRNTLLLIDEPDISLHPTGARYLRDELVRISRKNYVVYSTHSIFMIDSGEIGRHYIVRKDNEVTGVTEAEASNIADEEVLYNALGHSVYSVLKQKNLICEGWYDKRLLLVGLKKAPKEVKDKLGDVGICHARGAKSIKAFTPMIELAGRECLIMSDADTAAREQQKIYRRDKGFGTWKTYKEVESSLEEVTGEDFLKNDYLGRKVNGAIAEMGLPAFDKKLLPQRKGKLAAVTKWLKDNGVSAAQSEEMVADIKKSVFEDLAPGNIEETYFVLLQALPL